MGARHGGARHPHVQHQGGPLTGGPEAGADLVPDCGRCAGLCCHLPFTAGAEFPEAKPPGVPCRHLAVDHRCTIHSSLLARGWRGCVTFDCFGAGQHVTQVTYAGLPGAAADRLTVLGVVRQLHEMRFLLQDPACRSSSYAGQAAALDAELAAVALRQAAELAGLDPAPWRARARAVFDGVVAERHAPSRRSALLLGADLAGADLTGVDLLGADLRDADVRGARLAGALFLTQPQVNAAHGDLTTTLPARLARPAHWLTVANQPG